MKIKIEAFEIKILSGFSSDCSNSKKISNAFLCRDQSENNQKVGQNFFDSHKILSAHSPIYQIKFYQTFFQDIF